MQSLYVLLAAGGLSAIGQVLLKFSMIRNGPIDFSFYGLFRLFSQPVLIVALMLYVATLLLWLHILSKYPLSVAYPFLAVTYILVPLLSVFFFGDRVSTMQILGISIITVGLIVLGQSH